MKTNNQLLITNNQAGLPRSNALATRGRSSREQVSLLQGQSIFEVILALAVSAIMLTGIISLTSRSVSTSTLSKNKAQANRYASEAVEYFRKEKEFYGWTTLKNAATAGGGNWCMTNLSFSINSECDPDNSAHFISNTIFQRTAAVSATGKTLDISIKVKWIDEKGTHETYTISAISDW
jgi:type II secretory pathway pseudopilin PulG